MEKDLENSQTQDINETLNQSERDEKKSENDLLKQIESVFKNSKDKMNKLTDLRI